jgi:hypothetical protein
MGTQDLDTIHFPDLLAIRAVPDKAIRLYALIGAAISLAAAAEHALFEVYRVASRHEEKAAAVAFYRFTSFQSKRDLTDMAVRKLQAEGHALSSWDGLICDVQRILGNSARNLVGHNPVQSSEVLWFTDGGNLADIATQIFVEQNRLQVELSQRSPANADDTILAIYCQHTITLCIRLSRLERRIRDSLEVPPEPDTF